MFAPLVGCAAKRPHAVAGLPPVAGARLASADDPIFYVLHIDARGLPGEILINEIPVERVEADNIAIATAQVNMWIAPGPNTLRVRGHLQHAVDQEEPSLTVILRRQNASADGTEGAEIVMRLDFRPADPHAPFDQVREFQADPAPPSQLFQLARPVPLDEATCRGVTGVAQQLEHALARRDPDTAVGLLEWKAMDVARSLYLPPAEARASQRDTLANVMEDPDFKIDPLPADPALLSFEHLADGRLIRVSRQGLPAIQAHLSLGGRFVLAVNVAQVGGAWRVVR